ncbi:MAG: DUF1643 domain-containing protein [Roseburia sp.]|nr:DUF1643 domain-containing protein [Roseburia sp.]
MANKKVSQTIRTTIVGTERSTFEIIKEYAEEKAVVGDEVVIIQLYPTVGIEDVGATDSTTLHLQNKMKQLGWTKVHMVNLFSQIARRKPLAGDLKTVDKENMAYVKNVISDVGKRGKIVVAWGNSHSTNLIVNESKKELLEFLVSSQPENVYQLVADSMETEAEGTHILFLGLRYADDEWQLTGYPAKAQLEKISAQVQKRKPKTEDKKQPEEKKQPKRGKKVEKDVFKDNESA